MGILFALLGLCMGSFALAMASRMYDGRNWVSGRSECESCHHTLAWYDLVPLLSWFSTLGTCRYCSIRLHWSYPTTELCTAAAFFLSYKWWPYGFNTLGWFVFAVWLFVLTLLTALVIFDIRWFLLPDKIVFTLIGVVLFSQMVQIFSLGEPKRLFGIAVGALAGGGIFYLLYIASKGAYIGGGDVKYGLFMGILLGSGIKAAMVISFASILGTLVSLPFLFKKKGGLRMQIPFGPFLILATFIVYLWGDRILAFYSTFYIFP